MFTSPLFSSQNTSSVPQGVFYGLKEGAGFSAGEGGGVAAPRVLVANWSTELAGNTALSLVESLEIGNRGF
jgi:hypothetical protein